jgi:hypothetical protein
LESIRLLIANNASIEMLLHSARKFEIIKFLVEEFNQDLNKPFEGEYLLLRLTNVDDFYSIQGRIYQYELIQDILSLGLKLDLNIKDEKKRTIKERIEIIHKEYKVHKEKYPQYGK